MNLQKNPFQKTFVKNKILITVLFLSIIGGSMTISQVSAESIISFPQIINPPAQKEVLQSTQLSQPVARKERTIHEAHQDERVDDYQWLRNKENPITVKYLKEWNEYTSQQLEEIKPLSNKIYEEFISRIEPNDKSVPYKSGNYYYFYRMVEDKEYPIYFRSQELNGIEELVLDGNELAKESEYFHVMDISPSPDGKFVAFLLDTNGSQFGNIKIRNMADKQFKFLDEVSGLSQGIIEWNNQSTGIWYTKVNDELKPDKVFFHTIGDKVENDYLVLHEEEDIFELKIERDKQNQIIIITSHSKDSSEVYVGDLDNPQAKLQLIQPKENGLKYFYLPGAQQDFIHFSKDKKNWGLMKISHSNKSRENWVEYVPSTQSVDLLAVEVFKDHLAILKRVEGLLKIEITSFKDNQKHEVLLPQEICDIDFDHNDDINENHLRFCFSSPVTPHTVYFYDMENRSLEILKQKKAGNFDPTLFTTERIWATGHDDTKIPISLFYKKGLERDGSAPFHLYGYGAYGITYDPYFSILMASFLERGVCCGIAHVRGGGDLGRQWYAEGSMLKKKNTFNDFISVAEHIIKQGYTSPDKLVIRGGSAGGLLMGVVLNQRPDLFKACLAQVPFVDAVTTMFDETLPLTKQEWIEWGNPNEKEYYEYMKSYSPYDNVKVQNYPALFVTTGFNDAQVSYHEPAKWVAKLQEFKLDSNPLLFKINMGSGHHGASGRYAAYEEMAPGYAFLLSQLGFTA